VSVLKTQVSEVNGGGGVKGSKKEKETGLKSRVEGRKETGNVRSWVIEGGKKKGGKGRLDWWTGGGKGHHS